MNILVSINHFDIPGGSETYTYALINELVQRGYNVDMYVYKKIKKNIMVDEMKVLPVTIYNSLPKKEYDLIFASHTSTLSVLKNMKCEKIQTCHGIFPDLEQPSPFADKYISISKEVESHLKNNGHDSKIIYNGVDCDRFKPINPINDSLTTVLSLIQDPKANKIAQEACEELNINFIFFNKFSKPKFRIEEEINKADLVISLGRGAIESMACGRNVLIFDGRTYAGGNPIGDGLITSENDALQYVQNNFSGRYSKKIFNKEILKDELSKYDKNYGDMCRDIALKYFDMHNQVDKYLEYTDI
jgi:glycosyltransferase involved in cell wall biosynthesis